VDQIDINKIKCLIGKGTSFICSTPFIYYFLLTLAIFWPLLRPGYILTLDTVWVANRNYLAEHVLSNGIGGQTPYLAFLQLLEIFLPAWATQKIVLFLVILVSGISAHVSVPSRSAYGKYFAGTLYAVNPFIYTRFLAGHLYVILAYAFVPLAVRSFYDFLHDQSKWKAVLLWTTIVGIFTPHILFTLLLIQACIFLFFIVYAKSERLIIIKNTIRLGLFFAVLNSFWILPVFFSVFNGSSVLSYISTPDLSAFTGRGTISGNILISLAMMYGFWRGGYVYPFHLAPKWIFILLFAVILFFAVHGFLSSRKKSLKMGLALSAIISLVLASGITYPYFAPVFEYLFEHFFIFKGMRDSQKFVGVLVLAYSFLGGIGVDELVTDLKKNEKLKALLKGSKDSKMPKSSYFNNYIRRRFTLIHADSTLNQLQSTLISILKRTGLWGLALKDKQKILSIVMVGAIVAVPISYSFTMFNGFHGQIEPKDYPAEWYEVKEFLKNDTDDFDILFFPWHQYITFKWSDRRIANPANIFFEKPVISGQNAEVGDVGIQSSNPTQRYMEYLLEHKSEVGNFGELVAPLNARYIILAKDVDYQQYGFLYDQDDLKLVIENEEIVVFMNLHNTSRIRKVSSLIEISEWDELVELSKTIDINDYGFVLPSVYSDKIAVVAPAKKLSYTEVSPLKYQLHESGKYIVFTSPNHDQSGWVLDGREDLNSVGLTSVFKPSGSTADNADIYYKPFSFHIIGTLISLAAVWIIYRFPNIYSK